MEHSLKIRKLLCIIGKIVFSVFVSFSFSLISVLLSTVFCNLTNLSSNIGEMITRTMNSLGGYTLTSVILIVLFSVLYSILVKRNATSWQALGLKHNFLSSLKSFAIGFIIGAAIICATMLILINLNEVSFSYIALDSKHLMILLSGLVIQLSVALSEEITFRGYIQGELFKATDNRYITVVVTSVVFALIHLLNGSYNLLSLVYIFIVGILFSVIRMYTDNLWIVIGFHLANNWTEIYVFGFNVNNENHWLSTLNKTNSIWNGGESGSGLIYIGIVLLTLIILFLWNRRSKKRNI